MKILIIEDEIDLLSLYEEFLSDAGYVVTACKSGDDGISVTKENTFDLIISDKKMGKISGLDVLKHVEDSSPETPFFLVTGDSSDPINFKNPKSMVIQKPFNFSTLLDQIATLAAASGSRLEGLN